MSCNQLLIVLLFMAVGDAVAQPGQRRPNNFLQDTAVKENIAKIPIAGPQDLSVVRLKNGKKHGLQEIINRDGKLLEKSMYKEGFLDGEQLLYDYHGNLKERRIYGRKGSRSLLQGRATVYHNNRVYSKTTFKDSIRHGVYKEYHKNGVLKVDTRYNNSLLTGRHREYYEMGQLQKLQHYKVVANEKGRRSVLHGKYTYYNEVKRTPSVEGTYDMGKKTGIWREYHRSNGNLLSEISYKDDQMYGPFKKWFENGKPQIIGTFYYKMMINSKEVSSVNDGFYESYYRNGNPETKKQYAMGKPVGLWQTFYEKGGIREQHTYINGLKTGTEVHYDPDGKLRLETIHAIVMKDSVQVSVKQGEEKWYTGGVLSQKIPYKNGINHGRYEGYYPRGQLKEVKTFTEGFLDGEHLEYYENGQLQSSRTYRPDSKPGSPSNYKEVGLTRHYDNKGNITLEQAFTGSGQPISTSRYNNRKVVGYTLGKTFEMQSFPDGGLMSVEVKQDWSGGPVLSYYFYRDGGIRRIKFRDPETLAERIAVFADDGKLLEVYSAQNNDKKESGQQHLQELAKNVNPAWLIAPFFTDTKREGRYEVTYRNEHPFIAAGFSDGLPDGTFIIYEPVKGDTLVYKNYNKGVLQGPFVEKFSDGNTLRRGVYYDNGQTAHVADFRPNGMAGREQGFDRDGKLTYAAEYNELGRLKRREYYQEGLYVEYDNEGYMLYERVKLEGKSGWTAYRAYHPHSRQLSSVEFSNEKGLDSISTFYHKNGQVQYVFGNKENKRHGTFAAFNNTGSMIKKGEYVNGLMEGEWITYKDGQPESVFYVNGNQAVKPPTPHCGCTDTELSNTKPFYAPSLNDLVAIVDLKRYMPPYIIADDGFNYNSIFYMNHQFSNGYDAGSASMKLIMLKELAFYMPADKQVRVTLNPCKTPGYRSTMAVTVSHSFNDTEHTMATLHPKRIALELVNSPLKSADPDYHCFTALFNVSSLGITHGNKFELRLDKVPQACYSRGKVKDFLSLEVIYAVPSLSDDPLMDLGPFPEKGYIKNEEFDNFFGLTIKEANAIFKIDENGSSRNFYAIARDTYAGGKMVTGSVEIKCAKVKEDSFIYNVDNGSFVFTGQNLKKEWLKHGFTRLETRYDDDRKVLILYFFAE